jgi:hypothetical protein
MKLTINKSKFKLLTENKKCSENIEIEIPLQTKTVTPAETSQEIKPDTDYAGLKKVTVDAIPYGYVKPSGSITLTANGSYNVRSRETVVVNVPIVTTEQWDGLYEEIVSGYTVTLQLGTYYSRNPFTSDTGYTYSIDGGVTKIPLYNQKVPVVLDNVQTIGFYGTSAISLHLGSTPEGSEYGYVHGRNGVLENIISIDKDTTIYVSASEYASGGGND